MKEAYKVFFYGLLAAEPNRFLEPDMRCEFVDLGILYRHKLIFAQPVGHLTIVPSETDSVVGALYNICKDALDIFDQIESYPNYYDRRSYQVCTKSCGFTDEALVYVMKRPGNSVKPGSGYFNQVVSNYQKINIPTSQLQILKA